MTMSHSLCGIIWAIGYAAKVFIGISVAIVVTLICDQTSLASYHDVISTRVTAKSICALSVTIAA